jgi:peptide/nickel transport system ATP-binding protein
MPRVDREVRERLVPIPGTPPSLINLPSGCSFHPRCGFAGLDGIPCTTVEPKLLSNGSHPAACHLPPEVRKQIFIEKIAPSL